MVKQKEQNFINTKLISRCWIKNFRSSLVYMCVINYKRNATIELSDPKVTKIVLIILLYLFGRKFLIGNEENMNNTVLEMIIFKFNHIYIWYFELYNI